MIREEIISKTLAISSDHTRALTMKPAETIQRILNQDLKNKVYISSYVIDCELVKEPEYIVPSLDNHIAANVDIQVKLTKFLIPKNMILFGCEYIGYVDVVIGGIKQGEQVYEFIIPDLEFSDNIKLYISDLGSSSEMIRTLRYMSPGDKNINLLVYDYSVMPEIDKNGNKKSKIFYFCKLVNDSDMIYVKPANSVCGLEAGTVYKYDNGEMIKAKENPETVIDFLTDTELTNFVKQLTQVKRNLAKK